MSRPYQTASLQQSIQQSQELQDGGKSRQNQLGGAEVVDRGLDDPHRLGP